jgi:hypothetical protein
MKNRPAYKIGKIRSLQDLKLEKARMENDILKKENQIQSEYKQMVERLTFRNLIRNIKDDITLTTNISSKVISVGKKLFSRKKKKKKNHDALKEPAMKQGPVTPPAEIKGE